MARLTHAPSSRAALTRLVISREPGAPPSPFVDAGAPAFEAGPGRFALEVDDDSGRFLLSLEGRKLLSGTADLETRKLSLKLEMNAQLYGFGAATGAPSREHQRFRLLTLDTLFYGIEGSSYTSFPLLMARLREGCLAVLLDTTLPARVQTTDREVELQLEAKGEQEPFDLFFFAGRFEEVLDDYTRLVGRPFLPPLWSLGYQQSRWSYRSQERVLELAERFRREDVPCDVIHLDIHYMDAYRVFTWDPKAFPDPAAMHARLKELGIRTVAIVDPGVSRVPGYAVYDEGERRDVFLKRKDGSLYVGKVWPGETVFPDFSKAEARAFWAESHASLFDAGVSGIWNDMNDPVLQVGKVYEPLDEDVVHAEGSHRRLRNVYANQEAEATCQAFERHAKELRPFVLTRSGTVGIQKRAAVWTGDNASSWDQLRENLAMVLNLGLSGVPFSGADLGGFGGRRGRLGIFKLRVSKELFARWLELGAWMPLCRSHTVLYSPDQEPWSFGARVLGIAKKHLKRRYRLLPYLYALMWEASRTGAPVVRPLFFHEGGAPTERSHDQFLVGRDVLVAPVLAPGVKAREVWIPEGEWICFESGERFLGPAVVTRPAPLGTCPVFVRAGAVLPCFAAARSTDDALAGPLGLEVFPPAAAGAVEGRLVLDDGWSRAALDEQAYLALRFSGEVRPGGELALGVHVEHDGFRPAARSLTVRVPTTFQAATLGGASLEGSARSLEDEDRLLSVRTFAIPLDEGEVVFSPR